MRYRPKINFARAVCVRNALVDVHDGPVFNGAVARMEGGMLALPPPWSSAVINNDLIMGGGWYKLYGFLLSRTSLLPELEVRMILDAFLAPKRSATAFLETIGGPLSSEVYPKLSF